MLSSLSMLFVGIVAIQLVSPALPSIDAAFDVPEERIGLLVTAFFAAAAVTLPVSGAVADSFGRRRVAIISLAVFGVAGIATPLAERFVELLALRALQGAAFPGLVPLSITIVGDIYSGTRASMAQGLRVSVNGFGSVLVPTVAGVLAGFAWYYPFLLTGLAIPALVVVVLYLPETIVRSDATTDDRRGPVAYARDVAGEIGDRHLLLLVVGAFITYFSRYALLTYLPVFVVQDLGETATVGGILLSIVGVCRLVVPVAAGGPIGRLSAKTALLGALAGIAGTIAALAVVANVYLAGVVTVGYGVSTAIFLPVINDTVASMASKGQRASVVNTMELGKIVASAVSPAVFGVVLGLTGYATVFVLAGAVLGAFTLAAAVLLDGRALLREDAESVAG